MLFPSIPGSMKRACCFALLVLLHFLEIQSECQTHKHSRVAEISLSVYFPVNCSVVPLCKPERYPMNLHTILTLKYRTTPGYLSALGHAMNFGCEFLLFPCHIHYYSFFPLPIFLILKCTKLCWKLTPLCLRLCGFMFLKLP